MNDTKGFDKNHSSLELLWHQMLQNIDALDEGVRNGEDFVLQSIKHLTENMNRNQTNFSELINQISIELSDWENKSREEILTATTSLYAIYPFMSYEQINNQLDYLKTIASELISSPLNKLANGKFLENYVALIEKYVEARRNSRNLYLDNLKKGASVLQSTQSSFLNFKTDQVKTVFFPLYRFMERSKIFENNHQ